MQELRLLSFIHTYVLLTVYQAQYLRYKEEYRSWVRLQGSLYVTQVQRKAARWKLDPCGRN